MRPGDVLLVDTNAIIGAHLHGVWPSLRNTFHIQTVTKCIAECLTGQQHDWNGRRPATEVELRASFSQVHDVTTEDRARVLLAGGQVLDDGELDLWAHALQREDAWFLCGPDAASLRFGVDNAMRDRLVSLEQAARISLGRTPKGLSIQFTRVWHEQKCANFVMGIR